MITKKYIFVNDNLRIVVKAKPGHLFLLPVTGRAIDLAEIIGAIVKRVLKLSR